MKYSKWCSPSCQRSVLLIYHWQFTFWVKSNCKLITIIAFGLKGWLGCTKALWFHWRAMLRFYCHLVDQVCKVKLSLSFQLEPAMMMHFYRPTQKLASTWFLNLSYKWTTVTWLKCQHHYSSKNAFSLYLKKKKSLKVWVKHSFQEHAYKISEFKHYKHKC